MNRDCLNPTKDDGLPEMGKARSTIHQGVKRAASAPLVPHSEGLLGAGSDRGPITSAVASLLLPLASCRVASFMECYDGRGTQQFFMSRNDVLYLRSGFIKR